MIELTHESVGKSFRCRNGKTADITCLPSASSNYFIGYVGKHYKQNVNGWDKEGRCMCQLTMCPKDLLEELDDPR
jgi:hypothetical protein